MRTIDDTNDRLLTVTDVADRLGVTRGTIYRRISAGDLPAVRTGNGLAPLRVSEHELANWLDAHRTTDPPEAA